MNHAPEIPPTAINDDQPLIDVPKLNGISHPNINDIDCTPHDSLVKSIDHVQEDPVVEDPVVVDKLEDASTVPQVGTPLDPTSIPIHAPNGTPPPPNGELLDDVRMAEQSVASPTPNGINGTDVVMEDTDAQTPVTTPSVPGTSASVVDSAGASTSHTTPNDDVAMEDDDVKPPPAKRPRMHSDADEASLANSTTPPPTSTVTSNGTTPVPTPALAATVGPSTLSIPQYRFCLSTVRSLKKLKDALPFLRPVDPIALGIPHYPSIIKSPMDFATIERKTVSSNPAKPDPNLENPRYLSADAFIADVRLIFHNCLTFNGPDHAVSAMGKRVEEVFDKQVKNMPANMEPKPVIEKRPSPPPPPAAAQPTKKILPARRASASVPVIRRSDTEAIGRPKREIHPPPPKDLPYADVPKKHRKGRRMKDDGTAEQLRYCGKVLEHLNRKQHQQIAYPFYEPVDWVKLDLPTYPKVVKKPMDLSTMRKKLENHEYANAQRFYDDFKLMIRNCFAFNPAGTPVNQAGIQLQQLFDDRWRALPPLRQVLSDDEEEDEEEDESDDAASRARAIAAMESQIETMKGSIALLKKPKEKKPKAKKEKIPVASSSRAGGKIAKSSGKKKTKKPIADDDVLTFDQKKDLSEAIGRLDGTKLEKVIQIIHEGVPEIRDSTEEIELEIDLLPATVLTKLYNFVLRPLRSTAPKRNRAGKGTGTGGLKRKSMDEDVEAEKIRQLEQRMALFEPGAGGGFPATAKGGDDSDRSSDSSSASDSSGSDSE